MSLSKRDSNRDSNGDSNRESYRNDRLDLVYRKNRRVTGRSRARSTGTGANQGDKRNTGRSGGDRNAPKGLFVSIGVYLGSIIDRGKNSKKTGRIKQPTTRTYDAPPVVVRGEPVVRTKTSQSVRNHSQVRRRIEMGVPNAPAASISLPALPEIHFSWRILSMLLVSFLSFAVYYLWTAPMFTVNSVEMTGIQRIKPYDLNTVLGVSGVPSFLVDVEMLKESVLEKFPAITDVSVEFEFPNRVIVNIQEREPVLVWIQGGRSDLVDVDGIAFPLQLEESDLSGSDLPIVDASGVFRPREIAPEEEVQGQLLDRIFSLFREEEPVVDPVEPRQVITPQMVSAILVLKDYAPEGVPLLYLEDHGLTWEDPGGWLVYFGDPENIEMKLRVYHTILRHLQRNEEIPTVVSVEWVDAPFYRLER